MIIPWGKPRIFKKDLDASGSSWIEEATPVEDSTELATEKGDKLEAKIEGGENEDVRVKASTYTLTYNIRKAKGRAKPFDSHDGVVLHNYAFMLQPEDPTCVGFSIDKANVSVNDTYSAADGAVWEIQVDVLKPDNGDSVKWGTVTVSNGTPSFTESTAVADGD